MKGFRKWIPAGFVAVVVIGVVMLAGLEPYTLKKLPVSLDRTKGEAAVMKGMGVTGHILDQSYDIYFRIDGESNSAKKEVVPLVFNQEQPYYQTGLVYPVPGAKKTLVKEESTRENGTTWMKQQFEYEQIHFYPSVSKGESRVTVDAEFIVDCFDRPYTMTTMYEKSDSGYVGRQTITPGNLDGSANSGSNSEALAEQETEDCVYFYAGYNLSKWKEEQYVVLPTNENCRGNSGIYRILDWLYMITPFSQYLEMLYSGDEYELQNAAQMKADGIPMGYEKVADIPLEDGKVVVLGLQSTDEGHVVLVLHQQEDGRMVPAFQIYDHQGMGLRQQVELPMQRRYTRKDWKKGGFQLFFNGKYVILSEKNSQTDEGILISVLDVPAGTIVNQQTVHRDSISSLEDVYYSDNRLYMITQEYAPKLDIKNPVAQGDNERMLKGWVTVWKDNQICYEAGIANNLEEDYRTRDWMPIGAAPGGQAEPRIYPRVMFLLKFDRTVTGKES